MSITGRNEADALVLFFTRRHTDGDLERALLQLAPLASGRPLLIEASKTTLDPTPAEIDEHLDVIRRFMPPLKARIALVVADARRCTGTRTMKRQAAAKGIDLQVFGAWLSKNARLWLLEGRPSSGDDSPRFLETILVVEDEDGLRALICDVLKEKGYTVFEARSGAEALEVAILNSGSVDLLLTDMMMPGMNGRELGLEFQRLYPGCRVLFVSGYADDLVQGGVWEEGTLFLQKPFSPDSLLTKVREVLDGP
jgi:CheY-like chemotaxis protein